MPSHELARHASPQVAGLDVGWGQQVEMVIDPKTHHFKLTRYLPPGKYQFKFIMVSHRGDAADSPPFLSPLYAGKAAA